MAARRLTVANYRHVIDRRLVRRITARWRSTQTNSDTQRHSIKHNIRGWRGGQVTGSTQIPVRLKWPGLANNKQGCAAILGIKILLELDLGEISLCKNSKHLLSCKYHLEKLQAFGSLEKKLKTNQIQPTNIRCTTF